MGRWPGLPDKGPEGGGDFRLSGLPAIAPLGGPQWDCEAVLVADWRACSSRRGADSLADDRRLVAAEITDTRRVLLSWISGNRVGLNDAVRIGGTAGQKERVAALCAGNQNVVDQVRSRSRCGRSRTQVRQTSREPDSVR